MAHLQDPSYAGWAVPRVLLQYWIHQDSPSGEALPTAQVQPARVKVLMHVHDGEDSLAVQRLHTHSTGFSATDYLNHAQKHLCTITGAWKIQVSASSAWIL